MWVLINFVGIIIPIVVPINLKLKLVQKKKEFKKEEVIKRQLFILEI